ILQFVLLGLEDRHGVPDWILRLANDRDGWDKYPWGSYVWPTLYSQLRDANVRRWLSFYATQPKKDVGRKRIRFLDLLGHLRRYPRVVAWNSKRNFYQHMLHGFFHGRLPIERLTPDEIEARLDWWVSSRAYFDGRISEEQRIPRHVNRQNHYEVPSEFYRELEEQKRVVDQMRKKDDEREKMYEQVRQFMQDMNVVSGFPQGGPSSCPTQANSYFFEGAQMPSRSATPNWQTPMPSYLGTSNWESQMPSHLATPNWQPPIPSHPHDAGLLNPKRGDKTKNKVKNVNVSPLNLGNAFADDNEEGMTLCFG
ncbi:hypothetical protein Tco_0865484, partial [Tanacetum coccineum]